MPQNLHTAPYRTTAKTIADARKLQMETIYAALVSGDRQQTTRAAADLEDILKSAKVDVLADGRVIEVHLTRGNDVHETLTILTSMTREDRTHAAVYAVSVAGVMGGTCERNLSHDEPLHWLAGEFALRNL